MERKRLNKEELAQLYRTQMVRDFPKSELKPLQAMLRLMDLGRYEPLLILDGGRPVGYALLWLPERGAGALLEYFSVFPALRSAGLGTRILARLMGWYGQLFGEAEAPGPEPSPENYLRRRRIAFYERSGFRVLDYQCALFGVVFRCIYCGPETDDRKVEALHRSVYAGYFSSAHMARYIQLPLAPGEAVHPAPAWVEETVALEEYEAGRETEALELIRAFWLAHNGYRQTEAEAGEDLSTWTGEGHKLYFILLDERRVGLLHLGSRGGEADWLEDLFVLPEYQERGIGSEAVRLAEERVREYSVSLYMEVAAWNGRAVRLYRRLGYDCLNTVTLCKDFPGYDCDTVGQEKVCGEYFAIRKER